MRFYKMGNYSYDKKRILRIQRQSRELIIPLAFSFSRYLAFWTRIQLQQEPTAAALSAVPKLLEIQIILTW